LVTNTPATSALGWSGCRRRGGSWQNQRLRTVPHVVGLRLYRKIDRIPPGAITAFDLKQLCLCHWGGVVLAASANSHESSPLDLNDLRWGFGDFLEAAIIDASFVFAGEANTFRSHRGLNLSELSRSYKWSYVGRLALPPCSSEGVLHPPQKG
jgi:hypothetical protein